MIGRYSRWQGVDTGLQRCLVEGESILYGRLSQKQLIDVTVDHAVALFFGRRDHIEFRLGLLQAGELLLIIA
jgi:hypothetical protein